MNPWSCRLSTGVRGYLTDRKQINMQNLYILYDGIKANNLGGERVIWRRTMVVSLLLGDIWVNLLKLFSLFLVSSPLLYVLPSWVESLSLASLVLFVFVLVFYFPSCSFFLICIQGLNPPYPTCINISVYEAFCKVPAFSQEEVGCG